MSGILNPRYCWDTNVFLEWMEQGARSTPADRLAALEAVVGDIDAGRSVLIIPVLVFAEILAIRQTEAGMDALYGLANVLKWKS